RGVRQIVGPLRRSGEIALGIAPAPLEDADLLAGLGQAAGRDGPAEAGPDHDGVEGRFGHGITSSTTDSAGTVPPGFCAETLRSATKSPAGTSPPSRASIPPGGAP